MTKTVSLNEIGDEVVIEENGEPLVKVMPIEKTKVQKQRTAGLGKGTMWMSEDFDEELPDEFWGFDKKL
jgi:antitoxin (DNA-binding transcriptional repressor) of toxin-antitoxin stability system